MQKTTFLNIRCFFYFYFSVSLLVYSLSRISSFVITLYARFLTIFSSFCSSNSNVDPAGRQIFNLLCALRDKERLIHLFTIGLISKLLFVDY